MQWIRLFVLSLSACSLGTRALGAAPLILREPTLNRDAIAFVFAGDLWRVPRSGGDALPWFFRKLGLGPLVGRRTLGGVGVLNEHPLLDGGKMPAPDSCAYGTDNSPTLNPPWPSVRLQNIYNFSLTPRLRLCYWVRHETSLGAEVLRGRNQGLSSPPPLRFAPA